MERWTVSKVEALLILGIPAMITGFGAIVLSLASQALIPGIVATIIGYSCLILWTIFNTARAIWLLFWCEVK